MTRLCTWGMGYVYASKMYSVLLSASPVCNIYIKATVQYCKSQVPHVLHVHVLETSPLKLFDSFAKKRRNVY